MFIYLNFEIHSFNLLCEIFQTGRSFTFLHQILERNRANGRQWQLLNKRVDLWRIHKSRVLLGVFEYRGLDGIVGLVKWLKLLLKWFVNFCSKDSSGYLQGSLNPFRIEFGKFHLHQKPVARPDYCTGRNSIVQTKFYCMPAPLPDVRASFGAHRADRWSRTPHCNLKRKGFRMSLFVQSVLVKFSLVS